MDDEFGNGVYSIPAPRPEEDAASAYMALHDKRKAAEVDAWLNEGDGPAAAAPGAAETPAPVPLDGDPYAGLAADRAAADAKPSEATGDPLIKRIAADIGGGLVEAPRQVVGGVLSAIDEAAQFLESIVPLGGVQLFDDEGNFDLSHVSSAEMEKQGGDAIFKAIMPADADTTTGGFVRATAQFLTGFLPAAAAITAAAPAAGVVMTSAAAGAIADMVVFDPHQARLSTFLNEIPALGGIVPDYLADNNPANEGEWEGRIKNAVEGLGLGLATEGLFRAFKYYKAAAAERAALKAADPVGAAVQAGKDAMKDAAGRELATEVTDADLAGLGNPNGPLLVEGRADETAGMAFTRVADAEKRAAVLADNGAALAKVNEIRASFAKRGGAAAVAAGRDPMDEMIDALRSGSGSKANLGPKRPAFDAIRERGGIDPASSLAAELRSVGITNKTAPALFNTKGRHIKTAQLDYVMPPLKALDNIPIDDVEIFRDRGLTAPDGYIPEQEWIEALKAELAGNPYRTKEAQARFEEIIRPIDELDEQFNRLDIDVNTMSNASIKARLQAVQDEAAAAAYRESIPPADAAALPDGFDPALETDPRMRTEADLASEAAAVDAAGAVVPAGAPVQPKGKIFINHARINSADDVKAILQQFADADADAINAKRRGVVSNAQTLKESQQEFQNLGDLLGRDPGPMGAAQAVAARRLLASSGEQILQLAKVAQSANASKADLFNFRRAMAVHYALQSEVIAARTETARALQAWAIPAGATKARGQAINDLIMQSGGAGNLQDFARKVASVGDNPTALNTMARELGKGRFGNALYQVWINGLLSGPKTHIVNVTSNSMVSLWAIPERYMASGISKAFYGGEIQTGEVAAQAFGLVKGMRDGIRLMALGNKADGVDGLGEVFEAFGKADNVHGNAISAEAFGLKSEGGFGYGIDLAGKFVNLPGAALQKEDLFFKSIGYRMELNALAYRQAASEGLEGAEFASRVADVLNNPPEHLKAEAIDAAHYQTFTKPLGEMGRTVQLAMSKVPGARWIVPFVRTPTNIMKYTFERTPLAYMSGAIRADIRAGGARAAQAHARVALGSMIMLTVMDFAAEGTITGRGPLDANVRKAKMATGWMPYSINVGGRWVSYARTDPIGMMLGLGADMSEIMANVSSEDADTLAGAGVIALANNLANKTYMSGIFDFISAIDPGNPTSDLGKWAVDQSAGLMPYSALIRTIAQGADPVARDTKAMVPGADGKPDQVATFLQALINKQKKNIPGLSDELPPMRDLFGEPIENVSGLGLGWDMLSPIASRVDTPDAVISAIVENRVSVGNAPRVLMGAKLSPEEYSDFQEFSGKALKVTLDQMIAMPIFKTLSDGPDGMQAELIKDAVAQSRKVGAAQLLQKHRDLQERINLLKTDKLQTLQGN